MTSVFQQMLAFLRRRTHGLLPPREWMVEITNRCNLACPMCGRDKVEFRRRDMSFDFFQHLLEANHSPQALWPYGFGEPLMHPHLFQFIRYAKQKQMVVSLSTNGTLLTEHAAQELIDSKLDYLILAFDGATSETYARYRRGANFQAVRHNIERLLTVKAKHNSRLHITVQMIRMQDNSAEIDAFKQVWKKDGVDCVRIREDLSATNTPRLPQRRPCFFLWRGPLFVQAGGTVIPCPYYHGSEPFGDLNSQTVDDVWNSKRFADLRNAHLAGDVSKFPTCARCPRYQPHPMLAASSFFITTKHIRRFLPAAEELQRRLGWKMFE